jgi:hypothetical protein
LFHRVVQVTIMTGENLRNQDRVPTRWSSYFSNSGNRK